MREITLTTSALAVLIDHLPNPDDPNSNRSGSPVIHHLDRAALNTQPLPPLARWTSTVWGPSPEPWGPHPEPWLWAMLTRATISQHLERLESAGIIIVSGDLEHAIAATTESLIAFVDDICGTPPRRRPFPRPWGPVLDSETLHPLNVLVAGMQFQRAADALSDHPLHDAHQEAADRILTTALDRLSEPRVAADT